MAEKQEYITRKIGGKKDPLVIRALAAENPEFRDALSILQAQGAHLALQTRKRTPTDTVHAFDRVKNAIAQGNGKGDVPLLTARAIATDGTLERGQNPKDKTIAQDLATVRSGIRGLTRIVVQDSNGEVDNATLVKLNQILSQDPTSKRYAVHRLTWDLPEGEKNGLRKILLIGAGAAAVGFGLEFGIAKNTSGWVSQAAEGGGLFLTGQADDGVSAFGTFATERGGSKGFKKAIQENKLTLGAMLGAGLTDFFFLPPAFRHQVFLGTPGIDIHTPLPWTLNHIQIPEHVFHTPIDSITQSGLYWPSLTGIIFALTAFAGSITGKVSNIIRNANTIRQLDHKGLLPGQQGKADTLTFGQAAKLGFLENQSHPFRIGLLGGIGVSAIASLAAAYSGALEGSWISSTVQAAIGPLETVTAFAAAGGLAEAGYRGYRDLTDKSGLERRIQNASQTFLVPLSK